MCDAGRDVIYLQPILCEVAGQQASPVDMALFEGLRAYCAAFFSGIRVELRPALTVSVTETVSPFFGTRHSGTLLGRRVNWRNRCPANGEALEHGQLNAGHLLQALKPRFLRSGMVDAVGALPHDGMCVLGVTMTDLFCGDDDVFTGGLASLSYFAGVFSFYRCVLALYPPPAWLPHLPVRATILA